MQAWDGQKSRVRTSVLISFCDLHSKQTDLLEEEKNKKQQSVHCCLQKLPVKTIGTLKRQRPHNPPQIGDQRQGKTLVPGTCSSVPLACFLAINCPCCALLQKDIFLSCLFWCLLGGGEHLGSLSANESWTAGACCSRSSACHLSPSQSSLQLGCRLPNEDREVVLAVHRCRFPINGGDIPKHYSLQSRHWTGLGHILMAAGPASVCLKSHCP